MITQQENPFEKENAIDRNVEKSLTVEQIKKVFEYHVVPVTAFDMAKDF